MAAINGINDSVGNVTIGARPSSRPMAPLPARAQTGLVAWISSLGLASCVDVHPEMDRFDDPSGNFADNVPVPDMSMPPGWEHDSNWDSEASIWATLKGPEDTKASSKKCKNQAHNSEHQSYGLLAVQEKVTREYLMQSLTNTVNGEEQAAELRSIHRAYALETEEQARNMVVVRGQPLLCFRFRFRSELCSELRFLFRRFTFQFGTPLRFRTSSAIPTSELPRK
jgi:hypothetical protein